MAEIPDERRVEQPERVTGEAPVLREPVTETVTGVPTTAPVLLRDRVRWGPILAGILTSFAVMLILTLLGFAIGVSVYNDNTANPVLDISKSAALWSAGSALIAFFVGGWLAAKTAAVAGDGAALANGFVVGAAGLFFLAFLTTVAGLGGLLGAAGVYLSNVANLGNVANNVSTSDIFNAATSSAWIAFLVVLLIPIASALGGWAGNNSRADIIARVPTNAPASRMRGRDIA
ncbi:MAG TPA: hypothetical protein VFI42_00350 [Thermomicrobiaceae bacterium]|nr:hypothetical protein [Thermomicrobiaceae bacterium]